MPRPSPDHLNTASSTTAIEIDRDLVVALRPEAARRQTTVPRRINHLVAVTIEHKLLDNDD
jgi:hypothetical protein